eukprot:3707813-Amphidinium_carterae.3
MQSAVVQKSTVAAVTTPSNAGSARKIPYYAPSCTYVRYSCLKLDRPAMVQATLMQIATRDVPLGSGLQQDIIVSWKRAVDALLPYGMAKTDMEVKPTELQSALPNNPMARGR